VGEFIEALTLPFFQRAIIAGILIGSLAGFYGVFVIQRKLSFLGSGLSHAAFGGVALALLLNLEPLYVALPFTVAVSLLINWIREQTELESDTAIGIAFSASMALGLLFLSMKRGFTPDAFTFLFGSILAVQPFDVFFAAMLAFVSLFTWKRWGRWGIATLDRDMARADGLPVRRDDTFLSVLLAVIIVTSLKIVGALLISAFLVIPAASARIVSGRLGTMTLYSIGFAILSSVFGLTVSYFFDLPAGAAIVLVQTAIFGTLFFGDLLRNR